MPTMTDRTADLLEQQFRTIIQQVGFRKFMTGFHNACCHGEVFVESGDDCSEDQLKEIYEHIDALIAVAKKME